MEACINVVRPSAIDLNCNYRFEIFGSFFRCNNVISLTNDEAGTVFLEACAGLGYIIDEKERERIGMNIKLKASKINSLIRKTKNGEKRKSILKKAFGLQIHEDNVLTEPITQLMRLERENKLLRESRTDSKQVETKREHSHKAFHLVGERQKQRNLAEIRYTF